MIYVVGENLDQVKSRQMAEDLRRWGYEAYTVPSYPEADTRDVIISINLNNEKDEVNI